MGSVEESKLHLDWSARGRTNKGDFCLVYDCVSGASCLRVVVQVNCIVLVAKNSAENLIGRQFQQCQVFLNELILILRGNHSLRLLAEGD